MPVALKEQDISHISADDDTNLLLEITKLIEDIAQCNKDIEKTQAKVKKLEESKNHGVETLEQGLTRLQITQRKVEIMKESLSEAEKKRIDAIKYWEDFGFEAKLLPSCINQSAKLDEKQVPSEHYEFIFSKLNKRQSRTCHIGVRHKHKKLYILFVRPESCLTRDQIEELTQTLNEAEFNREQINWRQTMLTIRKALIN